jgi:FkbM family methyltransferase
MLRTLATRRVLGRRRLQPLFAIMHRVALRGMNFGPSFPSESGELDVVDIAARHAGARRPVIFDVGANVGVYARAVLARLDGRADLYCFEPSPQAFDELGRSVGERAQLFKLALGNRNCRASLYFDEPGSPISSLFERHLHPGKQAPNFETVEVRRLDDVCREAGIQHIDLLKLDVEGNELNVLIGAGALLSGRAIDVIQFEFGGCNIDSRTFFRDFFQLLTPGYRIHRIVQNGLVPVAQYSEESEIFVTVNYVAIRNR